MARTKGVNDNCNTGVCDVFLQLYGTEFVEASAKTGQNVGNALMILVRLAKHSKPITQV